MRHKINHANIKEWVKTYDGPLFDGVLCDPPYELGFMGKSWDSSGIAYDAEMWRGIFGLLKPGAHLLAFSGSRTYHRMAVAIEDAGFEIRDMIEWVYGSGFPKSLNIGKSVEAFVTTGNASKNGFSDLNGEKLERGNWGISGQAKKHGFRAKNYDTETTKTERIGQLDPTTDEAKLWNGYGTALKPAHEPCVLARKPIEGTVANNVLKHGTGGLNIDGTRVANPNEDTGRNNKRDVKDTNTVGDWGMKAIDSSGRVGLGRFPANLIHDGSDEVKAVFPQTGKSSGGRIGNKGSMINTMGNAYEKGDPGFGDSGSASRFFYTAKASRSERNNGLDGTVSIVVQLEQCVNNITSSVKLAQLQVVMDNSHLKATAESGIGTKSGTEWSMSWFGNQYTEKYLTSTKSTTKTETSLITPSIISNYLTGLLTNENTLGANCEMTVGGNHAENAENSNTLTLTINEKTASALGVENVQLPAQLRISVSDGKNFHSTVKPLSLTKYLATLIKPPTGGRLLVPFSGSGSEMIGALQADWEYVEGVELTEEYIPIAEARIKYWLDKKSEEVKQVALI